MSAALMLPSMSLRSEGTLTMVRRPSFAPILLGDQVIEKCADERDTGFTGEQPSRSRKEAFD
jgi:hypothetical protein